MAKKQPAPLGAPSLYKSEYCQMIKDHMAKGFSMESFAAIIDVSKDTLYQWCKEHRDFSDACDKAREKARYYWENKGIEGVNGKIRNFNGGVWSFWMKNRFKWHDNVQVTQDIKVETKQDLTEAKRLLTEAIKASLEVK